LHICLLPLRTNVVHNCRKPKPLLIMKTLHCSDAGFDCSAVVRAETEQEVLAQAAEHARIVHGVSVTPELAEQIKTLIKDENAVAIE
jgi:predicted small metal-binding protein